MKRINGLTPAERLVRYALGIGALEVIMPEQASNKKFLEILKRNNLPTGLGEQVVAMHREGVGGNEIVTFYGVGSPISEQVRKDIEQELMPLLEQERIPGCAFSATVSDRVLPVGHPARAQAAWDLHCRLSDPDSCW